MATYFGLYRIAEAKNETTVGGGVFRLQDSRGPEMRAFQVVLAEITKMGDAGLLPCKSCQRNAELDHPSPRLDRDCLV